MEISYFDIATSKALWEERVDPENNEPDSFETTTLEERLQILQDLFGTEEA